MAHVKHTAVLRDGAPVEGVEDVTVERGTSGEGRANNRFARGSWSIHVSEASSQSNAKSNSYGGSQIYFFGQSIMTVSRILEMAEHGYFCRRRCPRTGRRDSSGARG
jgi:hypothetical protein